ncbi:DUF4432 family protein [Demequina sp. SO4-13]|uniref:DUF4432 family protein n=1 Tax=Demequina sp. SO4-13 TaxID=3401027 RepID=UPI003AF99C96
MGFGADSAALDPELSRMVGAPDQLISVERLVREDGPGRGAPVLVVRNPQGVSFDVLIDRALDLGWADAKGLPLAWRALRGPVESSRYEPHGFGWTRTFGGGLLTTCGLSATGMPSDVDGVHHGLHGRVGHIPAENVRWGLVVDGADLSVEITGDVVETSLGGPSLRLRRRIVASTVRPTLRVEDTVMNAGHSPAGHMFRHHLNLGYPLVGPGSTVNATAEPDGERDRVASTPTTLPWVLDIASSADEPETVLYCTPFSGPRATVTVTGADGAWCEIEQSTATWPFLLLWRDARPGVNVLGVEPSTSRDGGRARAENDAEVIWLEPGESRHYTTVVRVGLRENPRR